MLIKVTQEDIDTAHKGSCTLCPVALAMHRTLKELVVVCRDVYYYDDSITPQVLPSQAIDFIWKFDNDRAVTPFEFEINK